MSSHTPAPWFVELTATAGLRIVHGPPDPETGFRSDVPVGLGSLAPTAEELANVRLKAASVALLESLLAVEWAGTDETEELFETEDCCPNCGAAAAGKLHFAHCELRDALDAALGVTSPRMEVVHG